MMEDSAPSEYPSGAGEITLDSADRSRNDGVVELLPGTLVGRYVLIGRLGAGAMGVVFTAFDPELDRKIALKFLHARGNTLDARARLLREAKSLGRLSHPNVVAVHDVGIHGEHIFLAMEFVAGRTLTAWLKEQPRNWPEVVDVLLKAGEGLAAAHDAGLVHRDFKPDNVLIGDDGRVRVLDFGLARSSSEPLESSVDPDTAAVLASASTSASRSRDAEHEQVLVTRTGALIGTPAYMSPEQHMGTPADALSDQFSFCVALYQGLYGVRPFTGARLSALAFQIIQGKVEAPPPGTKVPAWLRKEVVRGLSLSPSDRHPSMRALLAALVRERGLGRRGGWLVAGLAGMGLGLGLWLAGGAAPEPPCRGAALKLAGIWDGERIAAIERAFLASEAPFAADTWQSTRTALDGFAEQWKAAHHDACAARHIRGEQSDQTLDLRMRCLDRRLRRFAALSDSLLHPTTSAIEHVPEAIPLLGDVGQCADTEALATLVPPPEDPEQVAGIEREIADAAARELAADLTAAFDLSTLAVNAAAALRYGPLEADAQLVRGRIQQRMGRHEAATSSLLAAIEAAARGRDDRLAASAWIDLVYHTGGYQPDEDRLAGYRVAAEAAIVRAGDDLWLRTLLDLAVATALQRLGRLDDALVPLQRALAVMEREPDRDPMRMQKLLNTLGNIQHQQGALDQSRHSYERALAIAERVTGASHPSSAIVRDNLAELAVDADDLDLAERLALQAAEVFEKTLPKNHLSRADGARVLAHIAEKRGDLPAAEAHYEVALAIFREQPETDALHMGMLLNDLAILADAQGHLEPARARYHEALALFRQRFGGDHPYARTVERNLAEISLALDEPEAALAIADRLLATAPLEPPIDLPLAYILCLRAQALVAGGRVADAREAAERAVALLDAREGGAVDAVDAAIVQATLARILVAADAEPQRRATLFFLAEPVLTRAADDNTAARRALTAAREPPRRRR